MISDVRLFLEIYLHQDVVNALSFVYWNIFKHFFAERSLNLIFIVSFVLFAFAYWWFHVRSLVLAQRGKFINYLFPRSIWLHSSTTLDIKFFFVTALLVPWLRLGQFVLTLVLLLQVSDGIRFCLEQLFGVHETADSPALAMLVLYSLLFGLAFDFARFFSHYLHHYYPLLWAFHKIHHIPEVLTPLTGFRVHPLEQMIELALRLICTSIVVGVFSYFYHSGLHELTLMNYAVFSFFFLLFAHFRHSHIPLSFGFLDRHLISPVMHQLHHSGERRHFDKNMGFFFSFWDRMFGTLYLPQKGEIWKLGVPGEGARYTTLIALYLKPFADAYDVLRGRSDRRAPGLFRDV